MTNLVLGKYKKPKPAKRVTVCFDVDGTLIDFHDNPRPEVISVFKALQGLGCQMFIWTAHEDGPLYAMLVAKKLGLKADFPEKGSFKPDLAFDDDGILADGAFLIGV